MTYSAFIEMQDYLGNWPVFPRSKHANVFKTVKAASRALERQARHYVHNSRGLVYDSDGTLVYTIAL